MGCQNETILAVLSVLLCISCVFSDAISQAAVSLTIADINDYAPDFPNSISSVNVTERDYTQNRTLIIKVQAVDPDTGTAENVTYNITAVSNNARQKFDLTSEGELWLVGPVKAGDHYVVVIEARDQGTIPRKDHTAIVVNVLSQLSAGPSFPSDVYTVRATDGLKADTHLLTLQARDPDSAMRYSIEAGNINDDFVIDSETGVLKNVNVLSISRTSEYLLTVQVKDAQGLSAITEVDIKLNPHVRYDTSTCPCASLNNTTPSIPSELYLVHIGEATPVNTTIFTIPAVDADSDPLTFAITDGNSDGEFFINATTGVVMVARPLNYTRNQMIELTISATDTQEKSATTRLRILLTKTSPGMALSLGKDHVVYTNRGCQCDDVNRNSGTVVIPNVVCLILIIFLAPLI